MRDIIFKNTLWINILAADWLKILAADWLKYSSLIGQNTVSSKVRLEKSIS